MGIYKRGATYWIDINVQGFERIRRSAGTASREAAQELYDTLKANLWKVNKLEVKQERSWAEAVIKYLTEASANRDMVNMKSRLRWLDQHLGGLALTDITRSMIESIGEIKRKSSTPATANRHLALIRTILLRAERRWEWIDKAPFVKLYSEPSRRIRWLTKPEAIRLLNECPDHLQAVVQFALSTGLREMNILKLQWLQVDLQNRQAWIHGDETKNKRSLGVPLNDTAVNTLRAQIGKHTTHVFTYEGQPIGRANSTAWAKALERAGIKDFRFHDLRHTWASWHVQGGTPLHVLQELGGWETPAMVRRYAHLGGQQLQGYADSINLDFGTKMTQRLFSIVGK